MKSIINSMIEKYGDESQIDVAIEEMSELTKELIKYKRTRRYTREKENINREHVLEEMGDVYFMLEYLKTIFNVSSVDLQKIILEKAKRTKERYLDGE